MKIKAILFDMDGVLVDAKDWHYDALNDALGLFGQHISYDQHLAVFDGLPTKKKLEILTRTRGISPKLHDFINHYKQRRTMEMIYARCRPVFQHQYALARLKREGLGIAVCSNSIQSTVAAMMERSALLDQLDFFLSNEDVAKPKRLTEKEGGQYQRHVIQPRLRDNDGTTHVDRYCPAAVCQSRPAFAQ